MKKMLRSFAGAFATLLALNASQSAFAMAPSLRAYAKRPGNFVLPTGCPRGEGPQYQRFSPSLGRIVKVDGKAWVDFNPIAISRRAAFLCNAQISGQAICRNACSQLWIGDLKGTGNKVDDPTAFARCSQKCVGVPTFSRPKGAVENKAFIAD